MKHIYFFQVNFPIGFGKFQTHWLPYAVARLWSYARTDSYINSTYIAKDFVFERLPIDKFVESIDSVEIAAFSSYIWNENYNLKLAKKIKEKFPNCLIVFGGPQVPDEPMQFYKDNPFIDHTFHGESEYLFKEFLLDNNKPKRIIGPRVDNLDTLCSPFTDGILDSIVNKHKTKNFSITLETNRGCPYACTFCDWGSLTFNKVKKFNTNLVKQEIEWISKNGIKFVDVADANFGIFKDRDFELLTYMVEQKQKYGYPETYSFNWQKNSTEHTLKMVEYLTNNNSARGFTLSVQSMSDDVLTNIKRKNMEVSNFQNIMQQCNVKNIQTYTELILGLPGETYDSWIDGIDRLLTVGQHNNIEVWLCQMLINAELSNKKSLKQYNIETANIKNYISGDTSEEGQEGIQVIKSTNTLSYTELLDCYMYSWMITNFHSFGWTQIISRWLHTINGIPYKEFYNTLLEKLKHHPFYKEVRHDVDYAYQTGLIQQKGMHYYIAESQKKLHMNREDTFAFIKDMNYDIPDDIYNFTNLYVTNFNNPVNTSVEFSIPVWNVINNIDDSSKTYTFKWTENVTDEQEYYDSFYFRRRKGWGKCIVTLL